MNSMSAAFTAASRSSLDPPTLKAVVPCAERFPPPAGPARGPPAHAACHRAGVLRSSYRDRCSGGRDLIAPRARLGAGARRAPRAALGSPPEVCPVGLRTLD